MFNIVATVLALLVVLVLAYLAFVKTKAQGTELIESGGRTLVGLLDIVKEEISELVKDDSFTGTTELEFRNLLSRKAKIIATIRDATDGKDSSKEIVIDLIYNIVTKHCPEEQDLLNVVPFISTSSLTPHIKFEILMYHFKKILTEENLRKPPEDRVSNPERNAFKAWVKKYDLARPKYIIEDGTKASYAITVEEVEDTYEKEDIALSYTDMAHILAVLIFQKYKGFGCIDTLRAQDINGLTLGTSGSILTYLRDQQFTATQSIWCNFGGRYVHCRFLDFVTHNRDGGFRKREQSIYSY